MAPRVRPLFRSALAGIVLLAACSAPAATTPPTDTVPDSAPPAPTETAAAFPLTVTDDAERDVTLDAAPSRIVSLAPSNTEIVCALESCDRLVGVPDFAEYPAEVSEVPDVLIAAQY